MKQLLYTPRRYLTLWLVLLARKLTPDGFVYDDLEKGEEMARLYSETKD